MENQQDALKYVSDLAVTATQPRESVHRYGAVPYIVVPEGMQVTKIPAECLSPRRKVQLTTPDLAAFVALVKLYMGDPNEVLVASDRRKCELRAILDYHPVRNPNSTSTVNFGLCENWVVFSPRWTPEWKAWTGIHDKAISQMQLAQLIEDFGSVLIEPSAADAGELARTFSATRNVKFRSGTNLTSGDTTLEFVTETAAAARAGQIDVPASFRFQLVPWAGFGGFVEVTAALRHRIDGEGKLSFTLHFLSFEVLMDQLFDGLLKQAGDGLAGITTVFEV